MRPPDWHEHPDDIPIIANNVALLDAKISGARGAREPFSLGLVKAWHAEIHRDCRHVPSRRMSVTSADLSIIRI